MFEKEARLAGFLFISIVYICLFLLMVNAPRISVMQTLHILIILDSGSCLLPLLSSIACTDIWGELGLHCLPPGRFLNLFYHLGTSFLCITYVICNQSDFCHSTDPLWETCAQGYCSAKWKWTKGKCGVQKRVVSKETSETELIINDWLQVDSNVNALIV